MRNINPIGQFVLLGAALGLLLVGYLIYTKVTG